MPEKHVMPYAKTYGAAGAVKRPVFRTPLRRISEDDKETTGEPPKPDQTTGR